jgi:biopolymer transport protein ExbD
MDLSLKLPVIGSARPLDTQGQEDVLVLNIDAAGRLSVYGINRNVESYIAGEAKESLRTAQRKNPSLRPGDELPTIVVVRADRSTPFRLLNHVIQTCQENGYRKFALRAVNREEKSSL